MLQHTSTLEHKSGRVPQPVSLIESYHAHIYFDGPEQSQWALGLRSDIAERFSVLMGRWWDQPIGPHARPMYQVAFSPAEFARLVPWLMLNHGDLSVLIHPNTGRPRHDHVASAIWLGEALGITADPYLVDQEEPEPAPLPNTHPTVTP